MNPMQEAFDRFYEQTDSNKGDSTTDALLHIGALATLTSMLNFMDSNDVPNPSPKLAELTMSMSTYLADGNALLLLDADEENPYKNIKGLVLSTPDESASYVLGLLYAGMTLPLVTILRHPEITNKTDIIPVGFCRTLAVQIASIGQKLSIQRLTELAAVPLDEALTAA